MRILVTGGAGYVGSHCLRHLLRAGHDEMLEVDPANLRFLYQGVSDPARAGKRYGDIPWRLGLLEPDQGP